MVSIRRFLIFNLIITMIIATSLTIFGNYYLDKKSISNHLDNNLKQMVWNLKTFIDLGTKKSSELHNHIVIPTPSANNSLPEESFQDLNAYQFQIWGPNEHLLARSDNASAQFPITKNNQGFNDILINDHKWRTFTYKDPNQNLTFIVAEDYKNRDQFQDEIISDDIYLMIFLYPISGILIWWIITNGLSSLTKVQQALRMKRFDKLDPIDANSGPSEIVALTQEINRLLKRVSEGMEREKRFSADAAHELKTPLAALRTQAQLALQATSEEQRKQSLNYLITCVDRSTHIVQQLLTLSRLSPECQSINDIDRFNLSLLSAEVIAQLVPAAIEKDIEIEFNSEPQHIFIVANVAAISILLRNLIDNAIRYTHEKGMIRVLLSQQTPDSDIILQVIDNGPGIPKELRERVFERFFRILGNKAPGSGLGLAIVQQIVQLHHARISLDSPHEGKGLVVKVAFPSTSSNLSS